MLKATGGYGLHLNGASYWTVKGITVTGGQKGIMVDSATHDTIDGVTVHGLDMEGVHFRNSSTYGVIRNSRIYDTGNHGRGLTGANFDDSWVDVKGNNYTLENNTGKNTTNNGYETHTQQSGWGCGMVFRNNRSDLSGATGSGRYAINITNYNAASCKVTITKDNTMTGGKALTNPGIPVG